jgi:uncharacterized cupin superfamily protein
MPIISFKSDALWDQLPDPVPVKAPIGVPVAETRALSFAGAAKTRTGVWECTPGVWRRQIVQAELCTILSGRAVFEPDDGESLTVEAGDTHYFSAGSLGVWRIEETMRKVYIVFDEA